MLEVKNLSHKYRNRNEYALKNISLNFNAGEIIVLMGPSGAGKSTLMNCINKLVDPLEGSVLFNGKDIMKMSQKDVEKTRREIGMIFQEFNLFERKSVFGNVIMGRLGYTPTWKSVFLLSTKEDDQLVNECIERVDLTDYTWEKAGNLSGGQKRRVAIARTLTQKPKIILADEPVSALDPSLQDEIMDLLQRICKEDNILLIISLHHLDIVRRYADRVIGFKNGEIVFNGRPKDLNEDVLIRIYGSRENLRKGVKNGKRKG